MYVTHTSQGGVAYATPTRVLGEKIIQFSKVKTLYFRVPNLHAYGIATGLPDTWDIKNSH